jgi:hypothetical protein
MNWKKFSAAFIAAFIFMFLWGWLFNGVFMKGVYEQTSTLWRGQDEMMIRMPWLIIGLAILTFAIVLIFASGFAGGGIAAGIKLGIMLEILAFGARLMMYYLQPFPGKLIAYWTVGGLIEMMVAGAIIGAIYKPSAPIASSAK